MSNKVLKEPIIVDPVNEDWTKALSNLNNKTHSLANIYLSNFDNDLEPVIKAGGKFECNGTYFEVTADTAINGWSGIANDTQAWIMYNFGLLRFEYVIVEYPEFDGWRGGFYENGEFGNNRIFFFVYKDASGNWTRKSRLENASGDIKVSTVDLNIVGNAETTGDINSANINTETMATPNMSVNTANIGNFNIGNTTIGTANVSSNVTVAGAIHNDNYVISAQNSTYGTFSLANGAYYTFPRGLYILYFAFNSSGDVLYYRVISQALVGGTWKGASSYPAGLYATDGVHKRVYNNSGAALACHYRKFIL